MLQLPSWNQKYFGKSDETNSLQTSDAIFQNYIEETVKDYIF